MSEEQKENTNAQQDVKTSEEFAKSNVLQQSNEIEKYKFSDVAKVAYLG